MGELPVSAGNEWANDAEPRRGWSCPMTVAVLGALLSLTLRLLRGGRRG